MTVFTTCVLVNDSFVSQVGGATADELADAIVRRDRNVTVQTIGAPGTAMAATNVNGFNVPWTTQTFAHINGPFQTLTTGNGGIIIQAGRNDYMNYTWPQSSAGYTRILDWARANNVKVLMLDLTWGGSFETGTSPTMGFSFSGLRYGRSLLASAYSDVCKFVPRTLAFDVLTPALYHPTNGHLNAAGEQELANMITAGGDGWLW